MFNRNHMLVAQDNFKGSALCWNLVILFPTSSHCSDPTGWIIKEQIVYSTEHCKSDFPLFLAPSKSPVKISWWLPSQDWQCGGVHSVLGYFYMTDLFGSHINNLTHLTFPPFLHKMHHICPSLFETFKHVVKRAHRELRVQYII